MRTTAANANIHRVPDAFGIHSEPGAGGAAAGSGVCAGEGGALALSRMMGESVIAGGEFRVRYASTLYVNWRFGWQRESRACRYGNVTEPEHKNHSGSKSQICD